MSSRLLRSFDEMLTKLGYGSRSEAIRDMIRSRLVEQEWEEAKGETAGTITVVYDHKVREVGQVLTEIQHEHYKQVVSVMHIHLDRHNCLEVVVVKGRSDEIRGIAGRLISAKGVKYGRLTPATTGRGLT